MIPGFQTRYVECICDQNGRDFKLLTSLIYMTRAGDIFVIPRGASTDGASTPAVIFSELPPFGDYWQSALGHDAGYQNTLRRWPKGFIPLSGKLTNQEAEQMPLANLTKEECDNLLLEAMELSGVDEATAKIIYEGVHLGGGPAFRQDRS